MRLALLFAVVTTALGGVAAMHYLPSSEAEAQAEARVVHPMEIQSVRFDGKNLPLATLRTTVSSHAGEQVDDAKLAHDREALQATLVAQGYLAAEVEPASLTFDRDGGAYVAFPIRVGAQFKVRDVRVTGPAAKAAGVVTLVAGDDATAATIERAREHVATVAKAAVDVKLHADVAAGVVDVDLETH